jgi:hypothetical protein
MNPSFLWLTLFVWTLALELPVYAALLRPLLRDTRHACLLVLGVNLLTHPALFLMEIPGTPSLLAAEVVVAVVEALAVTAWLGRSALVRGLLASLAANTVSTLAGLALSACLA